MMKKLCFCFCFLFSALPVWADLEKNNNQLKGEVEQSDNNDNASKPLTAAIGRTGAQPLKGLVQQENISPANPALGEDPDAGDKELMVEWDRWRNRFLQAVLSGTTDILNNDQAQHFQFNAETKAIESKYPLGTTAWFSCSVTKDGQIKEIIIERPSGYAAYDEAVRQAVQLLAGSSILKFPTKSRRVSVLQAGGVQRTAQFNKQYFHFGDVEHYHVPGYQQ